MTQALAGLRVLDLSTGIAGPLGVLPLAEHGADVVKIEPPGGSPDRALPSSIVYDRSRRSVTIDLATSDGRDTFVALCDTADVLVEAFSPGTMPALGLGYDDVAARAPHLVYCSVPAWPTGTHYQDRPGYEALVHARTGQHWETPSFRPGPVFLHSPVASLAASFLVPIGIMSALHARERTGRGQHVEVSLLQGVLSLTTQNWNWTDQGQFLLPKSHPPGVHQGSIFECADRQWIHAATNAGITPTRSEASILGIPDLTLLEMFQLPPDERAAYDEAKRAAFLARDRDELVREYHAAGLGAEAIIAPHERFDHPQLLATGSVVKVDDPDVGATTQLGMTIFLEGTPGEVAGPRPRPGAHNDEVLGALPSPTDDSAGARGATRPGTGGPGPLTGLRVIDFGQFLAGPFGPMLLADLGADVIKVEPIRGDGMRGQVVGSFMGCQRGKRDIAIDLKRPEGLEIALRLVATADMVHHNMTQGTADRLGIGYEQCKAVRDDILYCNNYMYGATGPLAQMGGLDPLAQAASGIEWEQGPVAAGSPPLWYRYGHGDVAAAMPSVLALLIALSHRTRTGEGQSMWASLFHGAQLYTADVWLGPDGTPSPRPELDTAQLGLDALYRLYETSDGWLQLAAVLDEHWPPLCRAIGRPDLLDDERFATRAARAQHRAELTATLEAVFTTDFATNWRRVFDTAGVPSEVSVDTWDGETVLFDSELERLGLVTSYDHPLLGTVRQFGNLITFSDTPGAQTRATPMVGQHTRELLAELGYSDDAVDGFRTEGVVTWPDEDYGWPV